MGYESVNIWLINYIVYSIVYSIIYSRVGKFQKKKLEPN